MKKFKKLIPAFCAMLVSAAMLGTSTYAWFSVNKKVEANGMSVTAVADTQYFVISEVEGTFATTDPTKGQTLDFKNKTENLGIKPAAWGKKGDMVADGWYTANVSKYDSTAEGEIINVTQITMEDGYGNATQYFKAYTFFIGLAAGSSDYTGELNFLNIDDTKNGAAIAAIDIQQRKSTSDTWGDGTNKETLEIAHGAKVSGKDYYKSEKSYTLSAKTGAAQCVKVTVYVYLDGNNAYVIDSHAATLKGTVSVKVGASDIALTK